MDILSSCIQQDDIFFYSISPPIEVIYNIQGSDPCNTNTAKRKGKHGVGLIQRLNTLEPFIETLDR